MDAGGRRAPMRHPSFLLCEPLVIASSLFILSILQANKMILALRASLVSSLLFSLVLPLTLNNMLPIAIINVLFFDE